MTKSERRCIDYWLSRLSECSSGTVEALRLAINADPIEQREILQSAIILAMQGQAAIDRAAAHVR